MNTNSAFFADNTARILKAPFLLLFLFLFQNIQSNAQITSTAAGGPWSSTTTWVGGVVPVAGNNVVIAAGSTVTVTAAAACTNLTINGTLTMSNNGFSLKIGNAGSNNGSLTLGSGSSFFIGSANTVEFVSTQAATITNNGGTIASTGLNGSDGGTILADAQSGGSFTIAGTAQTVVYNLTFVSNASFNTSAAPNMLINGTFTIPNNNWAWAGGSKSPIYGAGSTLYVNNNGQGYTPGGTRYEWLQFAPGAGTIGVTPGYPNNVTIVNVGTSMSNYNGNTYGMKLSGAWSINGVFQIGNGTTAAAVDLDNGGTGTNSFTCGGVIINNGSQLASPNNGFNVNGNWTRKGATIGVFVNNTSTVTFGGNGPDTISVSSGTENSFNNVSVNLNPGSNLKLNSPVTLSTTGVFTLTSGIVQTDPTNILYLQNTSASAITNAVGTYINGPLERNLAATTTASYSFPVGSGTTYLPLILNPNSTSANTATVQAFAANCNGTPGATITSLSSTEYWSLATTSSFSSGANVSVSRPTAIAPLNMLAESSTAAGTYNTIGGSATTYGVNLASLVNSNNPHYFALANGPLSLGTVSVTYPTCAGTLGSVTVAGSGGTAPYSYDIYPNSTFANTTGVFGNLTSGTYIFIVRDNAGNTANDTVVVSPLYVTKDTTICSPQTVQLNASGVGLNYNWTSVPAAAFTGATNIANPVANPTVTTTYYVTSMLIDKTINLITNGDFESGDNGFTSDYIDISSYNGSGTLPYTAASNVPTVGTTTHAGIYDINTASTNMCVFFTPTMYDHTSGSGNFMVIDGPNIAAGPTERIWSQTVNVIPNNNYVFTYWFANTDNNATSAVVTTQINGVNVPVVSGYSANPFASTQYSTWLPVSYFWNSGASTTATITLYDGTIADVGNDFAIDDLSMYITCISTDSVTITVGGIPPAPTVSSPVNYCQNATATPLTANGTNLKWYDANNNLLPGAPTPSTTTNGTTKYYVTQSGTGTCAGESPKDSIIVNVGSPNPPVVSNVSRCGAGIVLLNATGTGATDTVKWYSDAALTNLVNTGINYSPLIGLGTTNYYVTITLASGCTSTTATTVTATANSLPDAPTANVTVQPTCIVTTGTVNITAPTGANLMYNVDGGDYQSSTSFSSLAAGITHKFTVENTATNCISDTTLVSINALPTPPPAPTVTTTQPTCTVATGTISVTAPTTGVTYSFDGGNTYQPGATSNALAANTYNVVVQNTSTGCISTASQATINAQPITPAAPVVSVTQPTCAVATGTITVTSPSTGVTYSFDGGDTYQAGVTSGALNPNIYSVVVMGNIGGCVSAATQATVNAQPVIPAAPVVSVTQPTCAVATGTITVTSPTTGVTYSFDGGDTYQVSATSNALTTNNYSVMVMNSSSECVSTSTPAVITAQPVTPNVTANADNTTITIGSTVNLTGNVTNDVAATYMWTSTTSAAITNAESSNASSQPTQTTTYTVTATTASDCVGSASVTVTVNETPCTVSPMRTFTPNGDGINDLWLIVKGDDCNVTIVANVYNRWGSLVYHSDNYNNDWNGTYQGKPLPDATYYYVVQVTYPSGLVKTITDNVTIIR